MTLAKSFTAPVSGGGAGCAVSDMRHAQDERDREQQPHHWCGAQWST